MKPYIGKEFSVATMEHLLSYTKEWDAMPPPGSTARDVIESAQWIEDLDELWNYVVEYGHKYGFFDEVER
jgi:hypothetical protein